MILIAPFVKLTEYIRDAMKRYSNAKVIVVVTNSSYNEKLKELGVKDVVDEKELVEKLSHYKNSSFIVLKTPEDITLNEKIFYVLKIMNAKIYKVVAYDGKNFFEIDEDILDRVDDKDILILRELSKGVYKKVKISENTGISIPTVSRRIKKLLSLGLVKEEVNKYILNSTAEFLLSIKLQPKRNHHFPSLKKSVPTSS